MLGGLLDISIRMLEGDGMMSHLEIIFVNTRLLSLHAVKFIISINTIYCTYIMMCKGAVSKLCINKACEKLSIFFISHSPQTCNSEQGIILTIETTFLLPLTTNSPLKITGINVYCFILATVLTNCGVPNTLIENMNM